MTRSLSLGLLIAMVLSVSPRGVAATSLAQTPMAAPPAAGESGVEAGEPGSELTVYVMTMGAGTFIWERFGHNAIWIHDARAGTDVAYNWGLFSFEQENFLLRFIRGQMEYWMAGADANLMANAYVRADRSVWAQELELTPAQRLELVEFLEWNARPENRFYRYDYFRDNCSTRVRDALDRVLGGQIRAQTEGVGSGSTYRAHARSATAPAPLLYTGIMLGLGPRTDREISVWEEMFMPLSMRERIPDVTVTLPSGERVPLVRSEQLIFLSSREGEETTTPPSFWIYLGIGVVYGGGLAAAARPADRRRDSRAALRLLAGTWGVVGGILGMVLVGLWFFTDHVATYANENLFHYNPLLLIAGILVAMAAGPTSRRRKAAFIVAAVAASLSVLGFLLNLLPFFPQENAALIALALPINVAMAYGAWRLERSGTGQPLADSPSPPEPLPLPT